MPELSWRLRGPRILLDVAVLRPGDPTDVTSVTATALVDTGATVSGVGPEVIAGLGLSSNGKNRLRSATDEQFVPYFLFRIGLNASEPSDTPRLPFVFDEVEDFSWTRRGDFGVILGMDILRQCDLYMERSGRCRLLFGR